MSKAVLRRGLSLLLSLLLILSISSAFELPAHAESSDYSFIISSNIPFADSKDSTGNPYLMLKRGPDFDHLDISDLESIDEKNLRCSNIDSEGLYWFQVYNSLDLEGLYLSRVTINGVEIEIPETCTLENHHFTSIDNEFEGITSCSSIYTRNFDYPDTPLTTNRGYLLAFSQIIPNHDVHIYLEYSNGEQVGQYYPTFQIAADDNEKAICLSGSEAHLQTAEDPYGVPGYPYLQFSLY